MSMAQLCPHCSAKLHRFDVDCPVCHQATGQRLPFYVYLIGAALVFLLFLAFADFPALLQFFGNLAGLFHRG
jgi:hypothetical protein